MIRQDEIEIGAVQPENFASDNMIRDALVGAVEQGRQGWGVRNEQAVMLGLSRQLKIALELASKADEAQRSLKGEQMAHGRTKAALVRAQDGRQELAEVLDKATREKLELTAWCKKLEAQLDNAE